MKKHILKRIILVIPIMILLSFFTFGLTFVAPSDPVTRYYQSIGTVPDEEMVKEKRAELGLDKPFLVQYSSWLSGVLEGDFGNSFSKKTRVLDEMIKRLPNTLLLTGATVLITIFLAVPLGMACAVWQNRWVDYICRFFSFFGVSMPSFWVGELLMLLFGVKLGLLPIVGSGDIQHLILPAMTLAFWMTSLYIRRVRGSALEQLHKDYVTGGLARGLSKSRILWKQILPNSLLSVITMFGISIGNLLGGATIVETIFEWQGIGKMAVDAIAVKDYPLIQGYVLWMALIYVSINLLVDVSYQLLDPRIRLGVEK